MESIDNLVGSANRRAVDPFHILFYYVMTGSPSRGFEVGCAISRMDRMLGLPVELSNRTGSDSGKRRR